MDLQQASSLKAALLLSRALCSQIESDPFSLAENGVIYDEYTGLLVYEGHVLSAMDMSRGALILMRALMQDLAEAMHQEERELARTLELSVALQDVMSEAEAKLDDGA